MGGRGGGRSETVASQYDRVLRVLEAWGYVDGWSTTECGNILAHLYTETDLVVADSLREATKLVDAVRGEWQWPGKSGSFGSRGRTALRWPRDRYTPG